MTIAHCVRSAPRVFVGLVLIATGASKVLDLDGFVAVVSSYRLVSGATAEVIGYLLPVLEITLGSWLLAGFRLHFSAWLAVAMHAFYFGIAGISLWRGIDIPNCGCFGVFFARPLGINTLSEDAVMIALSGLIVIQAGKLPRKRWSHSQESGG